MVEVGAEIEIHSPLAQQAAREKGIGQRVVNSSVLPRGGGRGERSNEDTTQRLMPSSSAVEDDSVSKIANYREGLPKCGVFPLTMGPRI